MNRIFVYSVIVIYDNSEQGLYNQYSSSRAAIDAANTLIKRYDDITRVEVQKDEITETGRRWCDTIKVIRK